MSFTTEEKIERLKEKGWIFEYFKDTGGNSKINAKFFETVGRNGNKRPLPLYNLYFRNKNDLVRELYYSSIGTQRDLAKEYGLTEQEVAYIKNDNRFYNRTDKEGNCIRIKVDAGSNIKCSEDVRFFLSQIQNRPYSVFLRKESADDEDWRNRINTLCSLLSKRTGTHYYVEYIESTPTQENKRAPKETCIIHAGDAYPLFQIPANNYQATFSYLNSLLALTDIYKSFDQRAIISSLIKM